MTGASSDGSILLWNIGDGFDPGMSGRYLAVCVCVCAWGILNAELFGLSILQSFKTGYANYVLAISPRETTFLVTNEDCDVLEFPLAQSQLQSFSSKKKANKKDLLYRNGDGWHNSYVDSVYWLDQYTVGRW